MAFTVLLLRRAQRDVDSIYEWIGNRSVTGAANWYTAFVEATAALQRDAANCARAPEAKRLHIDLRQRLFRTPRGRFYRILFVIADDQVRVLRVRGPGQPRLNPRDL